ncbi:MAG TPA: hypothetical protein VF230_00335 [Acidimicrobiales bacterium]
MKRPIAAVTIAGALLAAVAGGSFVALRPSAPPVDACPARQGDLPHGPSDFDVLDTVGEMRDRTDKAALVEVVDETWRGGGGRPRVNFSLRVIEPVKNTSPGEVITFSQSDPCRRDMTGGGAPALVEVGDRYLVFLSAWRWPDSGPMHKTYTTWLGETVYAPRGNGFVQYGVAKPRGAAPTQISDAELAGSG